MTQLWSAESIQMMKILENSSWIVYLPYGVKCVCLFSAWMSQWVLKAKHRAHCDCERAEGKSKEKSIKSIKVEIYGDFHWFPKKNVSQCCEINKVIENWKTWKFKGKNKEKFWTKSRRKMKLWKSKKPTSCVPGKSSSSRDSSSGKNEEKDKLDRTASNTTVSGSVTGSSGI